MRTHIAEILAGCQSKVAIGNVGSWDSGVDLQGIIPNKLQTAAPVALDGLDAFPWLSIPLDLPLLSPEPLAFHTQPLDQEDSPLCQEYVEVASTLPEMADPSVDQFFLDSLLSTTPNSVNGGLDAQPFYKFVPQDGTCSGGGDLIWPSQPATTNNCVSPSCSTTRGKVKCTWSGCWSVVKKDNYARHVNEIHLRQFRAVCASCGKAFQRPYMKKKHNLS
ncbi:uncharacterized protein EDB91DRAFT_1082948 [Suillus paluster]|uniref:uncharacterized protein n=1 Tax=Suillus paluster TaxID=48578 RepID=UPI001B85E609|nr:uncharacterized protein EDB91DRAFT_1082948 [Suillus paluster]KAG1737851.1 hypothetical protein EDB91DRAFT_1082948 [Suillus paluster]